MPPLVLVLGLQRSRCLALNSIVHESSERKNHLSYKYQWYFQTTRHDIWDSDGGSPPIITTVRGKKAVIVVGKSAFVWVLDMETGQPIYGY